jgi:probable phosphoglycerate mutase
MANAGSGFGLTDEGRAQVRTNLEQARGLMSGPVSVLSSPLLRARETAEIAAEFFGTRVHVDDRLIERGFGDFEMDSDDRYEEVWEIDRRDPTHRTWNVESVVEVLTRLRRLRDELRADPFEGAVILVTHGDVASTLICASSGAPLSRHREVGGLGTGQIRALDWPPTAEPPIFDGDS